MSPVPEHALKGETIVKRQPYEPAGPESSLEIPGIRRLPPRIPLSLVIATCGFATMAVSCGLHGLTSRLPWDQWSVGYIPLTVLLFVQSCCALWGRITAAGADQGSDNRLALEEHVFRLLHLASALPVLLLAIDAVATFVEYRTRLPIEMQTIGLITEFAFGVIELMWVAALPACVYLVLKHRVWRLPPRRLLVHLSAAATFLYPLVYLLVMMLWPP